MNEQEDKTEQNKELEQAEQLSPGTEKARGTTESTGQQHDAPSSGDKTEALEQELCPVADERMTITFAEYEELKTLARERDDYLKRLQRAVADYQNLQKRIEKARARVHEETIEEVVKQMLTLADSLCRALEVAENTEGAEEILEGLRLVEKEFYESLESFGVRPIQAVLAEFDPHYHEAIMQEEKQGVPPNRVIRELKKGFVMGDRVIRPSQVSVSAGRRAQDQAAAEGQNEPEKTEGRED